MSNFLKSGTKQKKMIFEGTKNIIKPKLYLLKDQNCKNSSNKIIPQSKSILLTIEKNINT